MPENRWQQIRPILCRNHTLLIVNREQKDIIAIFGGILPCLHGIGGECHGAGVLSLKSPFIIV